jgi:hypothetical protein
LVLVKQRMTTPRKRAIVWLFLRALNEWLRWLLRWQMWWANGGHHLISSESSEIEASILTILKCLNNLTSHSKFEKILNFEIEMYLEIVCVRRDYGRSVAVISVWNHKLIDSQCSFRLTFSIIWRKPRKRAWMERCDFVRLMVQFFYGSYIAWERGPPLILRRFESCKLFTVIARSLPQESWRCGSGPPCSASVCYCQNFL